jgi:outer membrane lipoprotein SlyB
MQGGALAAARENERNAANAQLDAAAKAQRQQTQMSAAGLGAMGGWAVGAKMGSVGGPMGAAVGAVVGFLAGSLF